ncbi:MAG: dihydrodipicolinate reductase, partial [Planctomycetes bacterium]|nr:dihydrodipicolinate reductase [Planctomycetota bacterium]
RRGPFQKKVGLNLSPEDFARQRETGQLSAHVGLTESVYLIGDTLGLNLDQVVEEHRPVIADCAYSSAEVEIQAGQVRGVNSFGRGVRNQQEVVRIDFNAVVGSQEYEEIRIEGYPPVIWRNKLGTAGDSATAAVILNMGKRVVAAQPGLLTAVDLSLPHFTRT